MRKYLLMTSAIALAIVTVCAVNSATADKDEKKTTKKFEAKCPVSGGAAKKESFVKFLGKKVYFCCDNCPKGFAKDKKKFANKAKNQLLATGQIVQVACPITGKPVVKSTAIKVNLASVAFCCGNCKAKAEKSDDQPKLIFAKLTKGFTLQDKCPVSGKAIDITKTVKYKGKNVYFCCGNCPGAFEKDPDKYAKKLPQLRQGKKKKSKKKEA